MPFNQNIVPNILPAGDIEIQGSNLYIRDEKVTYAKMQKVSGGSKLLGSGSGYGVQAVREISLGSGLVMTGNVLSSTGGGGSVTGVTASSPLASSGGVTPNITIQVANGSQNGYLSIGDWNTFNNKPSVNKIMAYIAAY